MRNKQNRIENIKPIRPISKIGMLLCAWWRVCGRVSNRRTLPTIFISVFLFFFCLRRSHLVIHSYPHTHTQRLSLDFE